MDSPSAMAVSEGLENQDTPLASTAPDDLESSFKNVVDQMMKLIPPPAPLNSLTASVASLPSATQQSFIPLPSPLSQLSQLIRPDVVTNTSENQTLDRRRHTMVSTPHSLPPMMPRRASHTPNYQRRSTLISLPPTLQRRVSVPVPPVQLPETTSATPNTSTAKPVIFHPSNVNSGGWKNGYAEQTTICVLPSDAGVKLAQSLPADRVNAILTTTSAPATTETERRGSLSSLATIDTYDGEQEMKDLAKFLSGERAISYPSSRRGQAISFTFSGCVRQTEFFFVLNGTRYEGRNSRPVYVKFVSRFSPAYKFIGRFANPATTELALLQSRTMTTLPEYVEHFWEDDYLVIVTETRGLPKKGFHFGKRYHEVDWVYYFNQLV